MYTKILYALLTSLVAADCAALYGQCGGQNWNGPTCCASGSYCSAQNTYYSQCVAGNNPNPPPVTTNPPPASATCVPVTSTVTSTVTVTQTIPIGPSGAPSTTNPAPTTSSTSIPTVVPMPANPYAGADSYINPEYLTAVQSSIQKDPSISAAANKMMTYATGIWMDTMANISRLQKNLQTAATQAAKTGNPVTIQFVVYDLPGRDCHALASNGEIPIGGLDTYKTQYIDVIVGILKANYNPKVRVVLIIEPDSLPNIATNVPGTEKCVQAQQGYED
ncbi:hypothetical protein HDV06_002736, partial [Boothiomyces sp. JEL0866]